jgi:hypothetical protein
MRIGYTEFSFGYAFTENLIRSANSAPQAAPIFPNLVQEGQFGYDVRIDFPGLPLFFQYKLSELMKRNTAFEIANKNLPGITIPFFRMSLMPSSLSRQHKLLMALEKNYSHTVFYASPALDNLHAFNVAYGKGIVHTRSVFFSPGDIGPLPDDKAHSIAYRDGLPYAWLNSDPKRIEVITYAMLEERMRSLFESEQFRMLRDVSPNVRAVVRSLVSAPMREAEPVIAERINARRLARPDQPEMSEEQNQIVEDILVAREMARVDLGVDLLISQPRG